MEAKYFFAKREWIKHYTKLLVKGYKGDKLEKRDDYKYSISSEYETVKWV